MQGATTPAATAYSLLIFGTQYWPHKYNSGIENEMCMIYIYIISRFVEISIFTCSCWDFSGGVDQLLNKFSYKTNYFKKNKIKSIVLLALMWLHHWFLSVLDIVCISFISLSIFIVGGDFFNFSRELGFWWWKIQTLPLKEALKLAFAQCFVVPMTKKTLRPLVPITKKTLKPLKLVPTIKKALKPLKSLKLSHWYWHWHHAFLCWCLQ
jgi:hypothetical protein